MRTYQRGLAYTTIALGLGGCEAETPQQSSQLERAVQAQGLRVAPDSTLVGGRMVSPETNVERELNLKTPENTVRSYFQALSDADLRRGHSTYMKLSHEKELQDPKVWSEIVGQMAIMDYTISEVKQKDDEALVVCSFVYSENGVRKEEQSRFLLVRKQGNWLLADK